VPALQVGSLRQTGEGVQHRESTLPRSLEYLMVETALNWQLDALIATFPCYCPVSKGGLLSLAGPSVHCCTCTPTPLPGSLLLTSTVCSFLSSSISPPEMAHDHKQLLGSASLTTHILWAQGQSQT
jgi:hypothetical protein